MRVWRLVWIGGWFVILACCSSSRKTKDAGVEGVVIEEVELDGDYLDSSTDPTVVNDHRAQEDGGSVVDSGNDEVWVEENQVTTDILPDAGEGIGGDEILTDDSGGTHPDFDPSNSFTVIVPRNTKLCETLQARSWKNEYNLQGSIALKTGTYLLPRQQGIYSTEVIDEVLFGPDKIVPELDVQPQEFEASDYSNWWAYQFSKYYILSDQPYLVTVSIIVRKDGDLWPDIITLNSEFMANWVGGAGYIGTGEDYETERQVFITCTPLPTGKRVTATTVGEDVIEVEARAWGVCGGNTTCYFLYSGEVSGKQYNEVVKDPFRLVYTAGHHNENEHFLMMLDQPAGEVAGLLLVDDYWIYYLDSGLNTLWYETLVSWEESYFY